MSRHCAPVVLITVFMTMVSIGCDQRFPSLVAAIGTGPPEVNIFDGVTNTRRSSFFLFDTSFNGGVRVAAGDINGDGFPDLIGAAGPGGGPQVRVRDGKTGATTRDFLAYDASFNAGVFVAAGDLNQDGLDDIITGAGGGAQAHVKAFSGADNSLIASFFAFNSFAGGVRVAAGDVNGDGRADIITGAGPGGGPQVIAFDAVSLAQLNSFFAYAPTFNGGVFVAAGDVNGDGRTDIITGADAGGSPHVKAFSARDGSELLSFFAYDAAFAGGVRVAAIDTNSDGRADILTGPGPGAEANLRVFNGSDGALLNSIQAFDANFTDGVFVTGGLYSLSTLLAFAQ